MTEWALTVIKLCCKAVVIDIFTYNTNNLSVFAHICSQYVFQNYVVSKKDCEYTGETHKLNNTTRLDTQWEAV